MLADHVTVEVECIDRMYLNVTLNESAEPYAVLEFAEDKDQWQPLIA